MSTLKPSQKVVTRTPVTVLWNNSGLVPGERGPQLTQGDIKTLLKQGPVQFVVADVGHPFAWIPVKNCFDFWKEELKTHLAEGDSFYLADYSGEYCYVALQWESDSSVPIVILEKHH